MSHNSRSPYEKDSRGRITTQSPTRRQAFNMAKDVNNIPRSQSPNRQYKVEEKDTGKMLRQWDYTNVQGQSVTIREDNPRKYPTGEQGPHFNAGQGDKLKQHFYYEKK